MRVTIRVPNSNLEREIFTRNGASEEYDVLFPSPGADWETILRNSERWEDLVKCQDSRGLVWWLRVESLEPIPEP